MIRDLFEEDTFNAPVHRISLKEIDRRAARIRRRRTALGTAALATAVAVAGFVTLPGATAPGPDTMARPSAPAVGTVYMLAERSVAEPGILNDIFYAGNEGPVQLFVQCPGFPAYAGVWVERQARRPRLLRPRSPSCAGTTTTGPSGRTATSRCRVRAFPHDGGGTFTEAELLERAETAKDYKMGVMVHLYRYPGLFVPAPTDCAQPLVVERPSRLRDAQAGQPVSELTAS